MIGESELILNARGAVYHLDLLPEEIADTIITVGDPARVARVSRCFSSIETKRQHREFVTHTGTLNGKRLTVVSTGIGTDNIDIVMTELDALVNIDLNKRIEKPVKSTLRLIRIGTSGSLRKDVPVDAFVASEYAIGMDALMNYYATSCSEDERALLHAFVKYMQHEHVRFIPYIASATPRLLQAFTDVAVKGITITCPGFYGPQGRVVRARLAFPNMLEALADFRHEHYVLTNFEMETAGIYGMACLLGHEALSLSAIVANRAEKKFSADAEATVDRLIRLTLEKLAP